jgi:hypothetical protein
MAAVSGADMAEDSIPVALAPSAEAWVLAEASMATPAADSMAVAEVVSTAVVVVMAADTANA